MFRLSSLRNYRASESRAEFTPAMPSAADNARSERVAEARVSRSLRWLTRNRAVRTIIYKRGGVPRLLHLNVSREPLFVFEFEDALFAFA